MSNGPLLFLGVLITLATSFWGLILAPQLQFGRQQPVVIAATGDYYPQPRPGWAERGADVYRSLGCVECHSQQLRQTGVTFDVWVTELVTNVSLVAPAVAKAQSVVTEADALKLLVKLPARVASGLSPTAAQTLATQLTEAGAKAEPSLVTHGPDIERQWGKRMSVSQDFLRDYPVQLGQLRLGPDLANYGGTHTNEAPIFLQLYQSPHKGTMMPPYRFLFKRGTFKAGESVPSGAIIVSSPGDQKSAEWIIPTDDGKALAAYLMSLKAETSLFEAPVGNPPSPAPAAPVAPVVPAP